MNFCSNCGTKLVNGICPNCNPQKKKKSYRGLIFIICILILIISRFYYVNKYIEKVDKELNTEKVNTSGCSISSYEFSQIELNMTYDEVKTIIGCDGTVDSVFGDEEYKLEDYTWVGIMQNSYATIEFENNKVSGKTQINLQ